MKHRLRRFALMLGGVLVPRISLVTQQMAGVPEVDVLRLGQLENQLALGQLSLEGFCHELSKTSIGSDIDWQHQLPVSVTYIEAMMPILDVLAADFELILLSDYPTGWSQTIVEGAPYSRTVMQVVHTAQGGPHNDYESLFRHLIDVEVMHSGNTVLVDWNSLRTRAALSAGLDAAIFVDAARFYRDLGLWGIVPLEHISAIRDRMQAH